MSPGGKRAVNRPIIPVNHAFVVGYAQNSKFGFEVALMSHLVATILTNDVLNFLMPIAFLEASHTIYTQ